ncbi:YopX family protein [Bacillus tequilensis]|uniref:YopX family protein n=1 Tax=Bacillus tequilensis TaxID=227866 RepID=UPI003D7A4A9E
MNTAYRVWDGEQMHHWDDEGLSLVITGGVWSLYRRISFSLHPIRLADSTQKNAALMRGTDKKGIYDGDVILREETLIGNPYGAGAFVGVVSMIEGQWCIVNTKTQETRPLFSETAKNTILGDVFQNPELLEDAE